MTRTSIQFSLKRSLICSYNLISIIQRSIDMLSCPIQTSLLLSLIQVRLGILHHRIDLTSTAHSLGRIQLLQSGLLLLSFLPLPLLFSHYCCLVNPFLLHPILPCQGSSFFAASLLSFLEAMRSFLAFVFFFFFFFLLSASALSASSLCMTLTDFSIGLNAFGGIKGIIPTIEDDWYGT